MHRRTEQQSLNEKRQKQRQSEKYWIHFHSFEHSFSICCVQPYMHTFFSSVIVLCLKISFPAKKEALKLNNGREKEKECESIYINTANNTKGTKTGQTFGMGAEIFH